MRTCVCEDMCVCEDGGGCEEVCLRGRVVVRVVSCYDV